jgi:hypothetical protein
MAGISVYGKEITAGCIAALITIAAMAALLKLQSESEIIQDQVKEVFREKLKIYSKFVRFLNKINNDGEITSEEVTEIVEWGTKLSLITHPRVIRLLYEYIFQLLTFGVSSYTDLTSAQRVKWKKWMLQFYDDMEADFEDEELCAIHFSDRSKIITALRDDLANRKMSDFDQNLEMDAQLDELLALHLAIEVKLSKDGSRYAIAYDLPATSSEQ